MATFFADSVLTAACTAANSQSSSALAAHWTAIVPTANIRAYNKLRSIMLGRGFTAAQFAAWGADSASAGYDWNKRFGVCFAFIEASKGDEDRGRAYRDELKDLIEELKAEDVVIGGEFVQPETPAQPAISTGDFETTNDRFKMETPDGSGHYSTDVDGTQL